MVVEESLWSSTWVSTGLWMESAEDAEAVETDVDKSTAGSVSRSRVRTRVRLQGLHMPSRRRAVKTSSSTKPKVQLNMTRNSSAFVQSKPARPISERISGPIDVHQEIQMQARAAISQRKHAPQR